MFVDAAKFKIASGCDACALAISGVHTPLKTIYLVARFPFNYPVTFKKISGLIVYILLCSCFYLVIYLLFLANLFSMTYIYFYLYTFTNNDDSISNCSIKINILNKFYIFWCIYTQFLLYPDFFLTERRFYYNLYLIYIRTCYFLRSGGKDRNRGMGWAISILNTSPMLRTVWHRTTLSTFCLLVFIWQVLLYLYCFSVLFKYALFFLYCSLWTPLMGTSRARKEIAYQYATRNSNVLLLLHF